MKERSIIGKCVQCNKTGLIGRDIVYFYLGRFKNKPEYRELHQECSEAWHKKFREWLNDRKAKGPSR